MTKRYYPQNIRALLTKGFNDRELRRLCFDVTALRPVYDQLAENTGKADIIDKVLEYAERQVHLDTLLVWAKENNSIQYELHQPYHDSSPGLVISPQFKTFIADKTDGFVGREYVFEAIDRFLTSQPKGYFIIEGDPGMGKSAILAEYVRRTGCIAHFNIRSQGINRTRQFLESVSVQLVARYGLPSRSPPADAEQYGSFFTRLLEEISAHLKPDEPLVIAVDALDEVDLIGHPSGVNLLYLPTSLPNGLYFILTQRRLVDLPFVVHTSQQFLKLSEYHTESLHDVQVYIRRAAERPQLLAWIDTQSLKIEDFVTILAEKSENNFMYLRYVLPDIERGTYRDLEIEKLPMGLEGYYEDHWRRMRGQGEEAWFKYKLPIIMALTVTKKPVPIDLIADFSEVKELPRIRTVLQEWAQFLHEEQVEYQGSLQKRYSIYHASFHDFIAKKEQVVDERVSRKEAQKKITSKMKEEYQRRKSKP